MSLKFPLSDIILEINAERKEVANPIYSDDVYKLNRQEFSMEVENVGFFYASGGNYVNVIPLPGVSTSQLEYHLNGSTYGAILHQRGILPIQGSSFSFQGLGVMICGETGTGKSSLMTSFVLEGNDFLTDDVTPLIFSEGKPLIWSCCDRVKLGGDSLEQLKQGKEGLSQLEPETEKYYFSLSPNKSDHFGLNHIFFLETQEEDDEVWFKDLKGAEKLTALRNEIYRPEYLEGMPENEAKFFPQLAAVCNSMRLTKLARPKKFSIIETQGRVKEYLRGN